MKRIGIIGTINSHAMAFAKAINLPDPGTGRRRHEDLEVTALFGPDPVSARAVQAAAQVSRVASSPEELLGQVDAVMITNRKGSEHARYALPFIRRGLPLFIDKPLTSDPREARDLMEQARKQGSLVTGGSGCKYACDVRILKARRAALEEKGEFLSGSINFAADRDSEYDGFYFYAPHLTEMALTVFGPHPRSVQAFESPGGVVAVLRYDRFDCTLHYTKNSRQSTGVLFGRNGNICREIDISMIYDEEVDQFARMLQTGIMPHSYEDLVRPVVLMDAILRSLENKSEVKLEL